MMNHGIRADEGLKGVLKGKCSLCMDNHEDIAGIRVSEPGVADSFVLNVPVI
jgi:hypothetical protein